LTNDESERGLSENESFCLNTKKRIKIDVQLNWTIAKLVLTNTCLDLKMIKIVKIIEGVSIILTMRCP